MDWLRTVELTIRILAVGAMGGALVVSLRDLVRGQIAWSSVEEAMDRTFQQMRELVAGRRSLRTWQPTYAQIWLIIGLAGGFAYDGILGALVGGWMGLIFGAIQDVRNRSDGPRKSEQDDTNE